MADSPHVVTVTADSFASVVIEGSRQRPVLVDFWADWCAPCRQLMPLLAKLAEEYSGQFLLAKVDTEAEQALAMQFGIRSLPTVQLFKDGQAVDQFMGALPEGQIRAFLERHIPNEADKLVAQARACLARHDLTGAEDALTQAEGMDENNRALFVARGELLAARNAFDALGVWLERTPVDMSESADIKGLRARLLFGQALAGAPDQTTLEARLAADPNDSEALYQLGIRHFLAGDHEAAFDQLLNLMQRDRGYGDDAARKAILMGFELLGTDNPLVTRARARLSRLLY